MPNVTRFEDLFAWQKARALTVEIYSTIKTGEFSRDFDLRRQIRRASVSTMSNIAEGYERRGIKEYKRFLSIAKGSCGEVRSQLTVAFDCGYLSAEQYLKLKQESEEVSRIISGLINSLN